MTRYTKYKKTFNNVTIAEGREKASTGRDTALSKEELVHIEESKDQDVDDLRSSTQRRSKPVPTLHNFLFMLIPIYS